MAVEHLRVRVSSGSAASPATRSSPSSSRQRSMAPRDGLGRGGRIGGPALAVAADPGGVERLEARRRTRPASRRRACSPRRAASAPHRLPRRRPSLGESCAAKFCATFEAPPTIGSTFRLPGPGGGLNASYLTFRRMLGVLYDVHGNLPALEAVIEDAEGVGADRFLLGGDYAFRRLAAGDRRTAANARRRLDPRERRALDRVAGKRPTGPAVGPLCGDPRPGDGRAARRPAGDDLARRRAVLPRLADLRRAELHARGRSRRRGAPRRPQSGPGRVRPHPPRLPAQRPRRGAAVSIRAAWACPATATTAPPTRSSTVTAAAEHRRVEYDHQASADAVRELYGDAGEVPARRIEQARFDVS